MAIKTREKPRRETLTKLIEGFQNIPKGNETGNEEKDNTRKYGRKENKEEGTKEDTDKSWDIQIL
jgi:hypothetical protein